MKKLVLTVSMVCIGLYSIAQQTSYYTQNFVNPVLMNPAEIGSAQSPQLFLDYNRRWVGFNGSPETQTISFDTPLNNDRMGFGVMAENDETNIIGNTSAHLGYAYKIKLNENHTLRFGLAAGLFQTRINYNRINAKDMDEALLLDNNQRATKINMNTGMTYQWKKFKLGFSAQQLLQNGFQYEDQHDEVAMEYRLLRHYNLFISNAFRIKQKWELTPHTLICGPQGLPLRYELGTTLSYSKSVWFDANYRHNIGVVISAGTIIDGKYTVGYGYEFATGDLTNYSSGSFEIILGIKLGKTTSEHENLKGGRLRKLEKMTNQLMERTDILQQENNKLKEDLEKERLARKENVYDLEAVFKNYEQEQKELEVLKTKNNSSNQQDRQQELYVSSTKELENLKEDGRYNYHVVVSATQSFETAKKHQKILMRENGLKTNLVQDATKTFYFLTNSTTDKNLDNARKAISSMTKLSERSAALKMKPWVYMQLK